jgi:hypothetical protein
MSCKFSPFPSGAPFDDVPTTLESASHRRNRNRTTRKIVALHQQVHGHNSIAFAPLNNDDRRSRRQGIL